MIKIKNLVKYWQCCGFNTNDAINEYNRLINAIWVLNENGVLDDLARDNEFKRLNKALMEFKPM